MNKRYVLLIFLVCIIFFYKIILNPTYVLYSPYSDLIDMDSFYRYFIYTSYQKFHEFSLWNPYIFSGVPLSFGLDLLYPFNLLFLFFYFDSLLGFMFVFHTFLGGIALYLFLRVLKLSKFACFIASVVYMFNSIWIGQIYTGHSNVGVVLFTVPLVFLFSELTIAKKKYLFPVLTGFFLGLQMLGANVQYFLYTLFFIAIYYFYRILRENEKSKLVLFFVLALLVAFSLAAVKILPTMEFVKYSTREEITYKFASSYSLPPQHLITMLFPSFFGSLPGNTYWSLYGAWLFTLYIGIFPLVMLLFSFKNRSRYFPFLVGMAIFALLFAMGKYTPLYYIFFKYLPGFNLFRVPSRALFFFVFPLSILVGYGVDFFTKKFDKQKLRFFSKVTKILIIIVIISFIFSFLVYLQRDTILEFGENLLKTKYYASTADLQSIEFYMDKLESVYKEILKNFFLFSIFLTATIGILFLRIKNIVGIKYIKILIFVLILIDLWVFSMPYIEVKNPEEIFKKTDIIDFLEKDEGHFRVLDLANAVPQEIAVRYGIEKLLGFEPLNLMGYYEFIATAGNISVKSTNVIPIKHVFYSNFIDLLNVKYIITKEKLGEGRYELLYVGKENNFVYLNKNHLPRAFIVRNAKIMDKTKILDEIKKEDFGYRNTLIIEEPFGNLNNPGGFKKIPVTFYSPNKIIIKADMRDPGYLVLSEIFHPGWKAYGKKGYTIHKVNYALRGIYLEKGHHEIEFVYKPKPFKIGLWISVLTSILLFIFLLFNLKKN